MIGNSQGKRRPWMLSWLRKRKEARDLLKQDLAAAGKARRLHGVNLSEWRYLGRTEISYIDDRKVPFAKASMFSFCGIEDTDLRHFIVLPQTTGCDFDRHTYVMEHAALWKIGERALWDTVNTEPSRWLRDHMLEKHGETWDNETSWWVMADKPKASKKKPKLTLVDKDTQEDTNNVVSVDFSKDRK